jgi:hypothetical protein
MTREARFDDQVALIIAAASGIGRGGAGHEAPAARQDRVGPFGVSVKARLSLGLEADRPRSRKTTDRGAVTDSTRGVL